MEWVLLKGRDPHFFGWLFGWSVGQLTFFDLDCFELIDELCFVHLSFAPKAKE